MEAIQGNIYFGTPHQCLLTPVNIEYQVKLIVSLPLSLLPLWSPSILRLLSPCDLKLASLFICHPAAKQSLIGDPDIAPHLQLGQTCGFCPSNAALALLSLHLLSSCPLPLPQGQVSSLLGIAVASHGLWAPQCHPLYAAPRFILSALVFHVQCLLNKDPVSQPATGGAPPKGTKLPFAFSVTIFPLTILKGTVCVYLTSSLFFAHAVNAVG